MFRKTSRSGKYEGHSCGRITGGFQYIGPALARETAEAFVRGADGSDVVLRLIHRHPGATVPFLARHCCLAASIINTRCDKLIAAGVIYAEGGGGSRLLKRAFYPLVPK